MITPHEWATWYTSTVMCIEKRTRPSWKHASRPSLDERDNCKAQIKDGGDVPLNVSLFLRETSGESWAYIQRHGLTRETTTVRAIVPASEMRRVIAEHRKWREEILREEAEQDYNKRSNQLIREHPEWVCAGNRQMPAGATEIETWEEDIWSYALLSLADGSNAMLAWYYPYDAPQVTRLYSTRDVCIATPGLFPGDDRLPLILRPAVDMPVRSY